MAETTTITVRVTSALKEKLDRLANITKRSRSFLATEALEAYADSELDIVEGILEGMADFEAGRYFTHEEVVAQSKALFAELHEARLTPLAKPAPRKKVAAR